MRRGWLALAGMAVGVARAQDIDALEGDRPGEITDLLTWQAWFVNIAGRWYLADHGGEADCT